MTIKHIVLTGGGQIGLATMGVLTESFNKNIWKYEDIESIWGTSSGSMVSVILCLNIDFETVNKYILERPWNFFTITPDKIINSIKNIGIFGRESYVEFFKPLFLSCDLTIDTTLKEFFEYSKKELYFITSDLKLFESVTISHHNHPDLKVIDAIMMSSAFPLIIRPVKYNDTYYFDGGLFKNFPIDTCLDVTGCKPEEILGIKKDSYYDQTMNINTIFDYLLIFFLKLIFNCQIKSKYDNYINIYTGHEVCRTQIVEAIYLVFQRSGSLS